MKRKIDKYVIYAARVDEFSPWRWWARPPWSKPVQFAKWADAVRYLTLVHNVAGHRE